MRLLHPSVGECMDRLTILARKIEVGKERGLTVKHWDDEEGEILEYLRQFDLALPYLHLLCKVLHLSAVNAMIWDRQNEADRVVMDPESERSDLILELTRLNRKRVALVARIGGSEDREKIHG